MRAKKAKELRKLVFADTDFREREYILEKVNKLVKMEDGEPVYVERSILKNNGMRKYYQALKKDKK